MKFALSTSHEPRATSHGIDVFTTRIDTIYGANFILLAPEHPLVQAWSQVPGSEAFRANMQRFQAQDRTARMTGDVEKEGFDTGRTAINPFTGRPVPIWVANFVLGEYGTGAVMGVPAHDQRDFEFARKYGLPITVVVQPASAQGSGGAGSASAQGSGGTGPAETLSSDSMTESYDGPGTLVESGEFSGVPSAEAIDRMTASAIILVMTSGPSCPVYSSD